jgi:tetratricopeptide (TPR) repeat protein
MSKRGILALVVVGLVILTLMWILMPARRGASSRGVADVARETPPAEVTGPFHVGVSSLDVEENERAGRLFEDLTRQLPREPAVWANLGIARLRTGDLPGAQSALERAAELSPGDEQVTLLRAIVDEHRGEFDQAIERLRALRDADVAALYRLAELLGRTGRKEDLAEQLEVHERIRQRDAGNMVAAFSRARLLARMENGPLLSEALTALEAHRGKWEPPAVQQFESAREAAGAGDFRSAATHLAFLQNLNLPTPEYQAALAELGVRGGSIGQPIREFLRYAMPPIVVAEADTALRWALAEPAGEGPVEFFAALAFGTNARPNLVSISGRSLRISGFAEVTPGPTTNAGRHSIAVADFNGDFLMDLAWIGETGLKIWTQSSAGQFAAVQPASEARSDFDAPGAGVWTFDFEADGDMDLVIGRPQSSPQLLRNNGDGGFTFMDAFASFPALRELCWADFDGDGDGDLAMLDAARRVLVSWNNRSGAFTDPVPVTDADAVAISFGDILAGGSMSLVMLEVNGALSQCAFHSTSNAWSRTELARWSSPPDLAEAWSMRRASLAVADIDNNGAVDGIASAGLNTAVWLRRADNSFQLHEDTPALFVTSVADTNDDGLLDLVGLNSSGAAIAHGRGTKNYHWQVLQTRTLATVADGRLNSFGIGGRIEVRAGPLLAGMPIVSPHTHFGLGTQEQVGVARIVWPNGVAQVEFDLQADHAVTAVQRLKGSCPWVFTRNDEGLTFLKDFIWRSPLGMRINSQDTAGLDQTEDWILIPGTSLTARDGAYEIRITAELWETHFFDHISLMILDHPADVSVFVDERFVPTRPPNLEVITTASPRQLGWARDERGTDVTGAIRTADGEYVDGFRLGRFQGIAEDHWVEFELPDDAPSNEALVLIGHAWIYPTDSSLNVAVSQGQHPAPRGLVLEVHDPASGWCAVSDDLGFPAGKNKTVVIPLPAGHRRFRLRTNLEIYWDRMTWAVALHDAEVRSHRAETIVADLRHRGFSRLAPAERRKPDLPRYDAMAGPGPRWRDLEGFYTRFGDVRELLEAIDDRYVIMNAGDEFVLRFRSPSDALPPGWSRDFILRGDGWVKDGDFNTVNSRTVHPLPSHSTSRYESAPRTLDEDPIFQGNIQDWRRFHTRYVTPTHFERGLMNGALVQTIGGSR